MDAEKMEQELRVIVLNAKNFFVQIVNIQIIKVLRLKNLILDAKSIIIHLIFIVKIVIKIFVHFVSQCIKIMI